MMVYTGEEDLADEGDGEELRTVETVKLLGSAVTKVIHRCKAAQDDIELNLSLCSLLKVPDAVLSLVESLPIKELDLSDNFLTRVPTKLHVSLPSLTHLNLSSNNLSSLGTELRLCYNLNTLDLSRNSFFKFPREVLGLPEVKRVHLDENFIDEVELFLINGLKKLDVLDLQGNPLKTENRKILQRVKSVSIYVTEVNNEEWEDLDI